MSNEIDKKYLNKKQRFGQKLIELADKLINAAGKEKNQIIVKNIEKNMGKMWYYNSKIL